MSWYLLLVALVAAERIAELVIARRNEQWSRARGAIEKGASHYPFIVALHAGLLVGAVVEVWAGERPFIPALGWPMLALVVLAQALRWWCIATLGRQWNTRIFVIPTMARVTAGPYRLLPHPNYVAVAVEGAALPLVHLAWMTAASFTLLNSVLLRIRIVAEDEALHSLAIEN